MNIDKKEIQQLLRIFSHDLRNPLVNLRALLHDTRASLDESLSNPNSKVLQEQLPETLDMFEESVNRMNTMIMGINDIYHAMYDELQCEHVDMNDLFSRELRKLSIHTKQVEIVGSDLPILWADPLAMSDIVVSLLNYTGNLLFDDGGSIQVASEKQDMMDGFTVSVSCALSVTDMEHVFDPFYIPYGKKNNIDLARVKALVESHGGQIRCESKSGEGTVFCILMPTCSEFP